MPTQSKKALVRRRRKRRRLLMPRSLRRPRAIKLCRTGSQRLDKRSRRLQVLQQPRCSPITSPAMITCSRQSLEQNLSAVRLQRPLQQMKTKSPARRPIPSKMILHSQKRPQPQLQRRRAQRIRTTVPTRKTEELLILRRRISQVVLRRAKL